jgi:hypothetical protein
MTTPTEVEEVITAGRKEGRKVNYSTTAGWMIDDR